MAEQPSKNPGVSKGLSERRKSAKKYFFMDGKLYKILREERAKDVLTAWDFDEDKVAQFVLTDAKRTMRPAFDTVEVAKLLNRGRAVIQTYVNHGKINSPARIYSKGMNAYGQPFTFMKWSEEDILALHEYIVGVGYGAHSLPTRRELVAMMRQKPMFYMRTAEGEMVPVWSAYNEI